MALIKCYECNKDISSLAPHCVHCGAPRKSGFISTGDSVEKVTFEKKETESIINKPRKMQDYTPASKLPPPPKMQDYTPANNSSKLREFFEKNTKINWLSYLSTFFFYFFIPTSSTLNNPFGTLFCAICAVVSYRCWLSRRTFSKLKHFNPQDNFFLRVYIPSLWSYLWRSLLVLVFVGGAVEFLVGSGWVGGPGSLLGTMIAFWLLGTMLSIDMPLWANQALKKYTAEDSKT